MSKGHKYAIKISDSVSIKLKSSRFSHIKKTESQKKKNFQLIFFTKRNESSRYVNTDLHFWQGKKLL